MSAEPQTFDWLPEGNWVDLGYDNAPTESQLRSQVDAGEHNDAYGDLGCPDCGNVDLFWKTHSSKGQRYRCLSCEYSSNWETVKSQGDLTLQKFGLTVDCPLCGETISAYNRASIDSHFRKHKKEAAEASEPKVSESESEHEWQEEIEWNEKPKKKTDPEWEDVEWDSETRRCCECHTTERLTTIQAGTFCYDCLPINLGAEDDYWAGSVAKAIVNEMGDDYYFNEDLDEYDCLHFAQEMSEYLTQDEIPHEIQSIAGYGGEVAHAWVYVPSEGEYYDAWTPYGVSDWKDLGFWETLDYTPESFEAEVHLLPDVPMAGWYDRHDDSVNINLANKGIRNEALEDNYSGLFDTIAHEYGHQVTSHETRSPYHSEFAAFMVQTNGDFARSKLLAVIHPTCVHEIIMKLPPDSNGMISDETLDNFFSTLDFENNLDIIVQAKRFVTYSTIPEWHKEWLKHLISYVETGTSANVSFEAEDNYDSTYGKAQAKIRRTLKNKIKKQAIMGTKAGQWSARKSQELKRQYEAACSKKGLQPYKGSKTKKQQDLSDWSKQKWKTASGKKSSTTGEPYFPAKAVAALKQKKLYAKAKRQKQAATKAGKQNARYSDDIRAVVKQYRAEEDSVSTQEVLNWINRPQIITESYEFPSEPVRCVYCGSDDITTDGLEAGWSGGTVTTDVTCLAEDCQATWRDYFRYVDTEIIVPTSLTLDSEDALHDEQLEIEIEGIDETYGLSSSDPEMLSVAESAVSQYQSRTDLPETFQLHTKPHFVFVSADAFGRSSHVARFRSQTASHIPIIMLSSEAIRESADQYGVSLETAVQTTVWHELGHVLCELWDMEEIYPFDNSTQEEEFAESIAESMYFQEPFQNPEV